MAVEDGAVLGDIFAHLSDRSQIPHFLALYEKFRKPRATKIVQKARLPDTTTTWRTGRNKSSEIPSYRTVLASKTSRTPGAIPSSENGCSPTTVATLPNKRGRTSAGLVTPDCETCDEMKDSDTPILLAFYCIQR